MEGKVGAGDFDDMADGMQCTAHPYRNNLGGICAFCLQDKLGKLVSSSAFPFAVAVASSSPSSPPSFRSDVASSTAAAAAVNSTALYSSKSSKLDHERNKSRMISFLLAKKSKNKKPSSSEASLKRSKSTAAARHGTRAALEHFGSRNHRNYFDGNHADGSSNMSPRRRGSFWSFLSSKSAIRKQAGDPKSSNAAEDTLSAFQEDDDDVSPVNSQSTAAVSVSLPPGAFDRKVSRSRSVGCGSRSFSGDIFERISNGLGDCALRRVESQREGRPKNHHHLEQPSSAIAAAHHHRCMKERVKCAGIIFGGFSSSSSSSSSYWVPSSGEDKPAHLRHHKSWNWAFASPMRAFTRPPSTKYSKREMPSNKNSVPNLAAIPSILAVVGG